MIIDAHAHVIRQITGMGPKGEVFSAGDGKLGWMDGQTARIILRGMGDDSFLAEALLAQMDKAGIDKAVLLHGFLYGLQNQYVFQCARRYPDRFIPSGSLDPYIVRKDLVLHTLLERYGVRILKFELSSGAGLCGYHPDFKLNSDIMEAVYQAAAQWDAAIVFDLGSRGMASYQIEELRQVVRRHPCVRFVVCHLLAPGRGDFELWRTDIKALLAENVWLDCTAMPWNIREEYPFKTSARYVREAKVLAGFDRLIWGSDAPCTLTLHPYKLQYQYLEQSGGFTAMELEHILCKNAQTAYKI